MQDTGADTASTSIIRGLTGGRPGDTAVTAGGGQGSAESSNGDAGTSTAAIIQGLVGGKAGGAADQDTIDSGAARATAEQPGRDTAVHRHAARAKIPAPAAPTVARSRGTSSDHLADNPSDQSVAVNNLGILKAPEPEAYENPATLSGDLGSDRAFVPEGSPLRGANSDSASTTSEASTTFTWPMIDPSTNRAGSGRHTLNHPAGQTRAIRDDENGAPKSAAGGFIPDWIRQMSPAEALGYLSAMGLVIGLMAGAVSGRRTLDSD